MIGWRQIVLIFSLVLLGVIGAASLFLKTQRLPHLSYPNLKTYENTECGIRFQYPENWTIRKHHYGWEKDICSIEVLEPTAPDYPGPNRRVTIHFPSDGGDRGYILAWYGTCEKQFIQIRDQGEKQGDHLNEAIQWKKKHCPDIYASNLEDLVQALGEPQKRMKGLGDTQIIFYSGDTYYGDTYYLQSGDHIVEIENPYIEFGDNIPTSFEFTK